MARVWLDVSNLLASPHAPGAARVEAECAQSALALPEAFSFCHLDAAHGFRKVEDATVQALSHQASLPDPASGPGLRNAVKRLIGKLPPSLQPAVWSLARGLARVLRGGPLRAPHADAGQAAAPPFGAADVYLSLRPDWRGADLALLGDARRQLGLRVVLAGSPNQPADASADEAWAHAKARQAAGAQLLKPALVLASQGGASFEDRLQHLYMSFLREGDRCIDIGAHTGRHSLPMSCAVGTTGSVAAFEPSPAIAQRLRARLQALASTNISVHETALSDESGSAEFVIAVDLPEESGLKERSVYNGATRTEKVTVRLARLDSLDIPQPRFIKLDTEGAEYKVLLGARETIARSRPVVAFEFGQASYAAYDVDPVDVYRYFDSLGYDMHSIHGDRLGEAEFAEASRVQRYWDYVACDRAEAPAISAILRSFPPSR